MYIKIKNTNKIYSTSLEFYSTSLCETKHATAHFKKEIQKIFLYKDGVIIAEFGNTIEPVYKTEDNKIEKNAFVSNLYSFTLSQDFKKAVKLNLNRNDNFYINYAGKYHFESGYALYIHADEVKLNYLGEFLAFENDGEKSYKRYYAMKFENAEYTHFYIQRYPADAIDELKQKYGQMRVDCGYGTKDAPCIEPFDYTEHITRYPGLKKKNVPEKGYYVRWSSVEQIPDNTIVVTFGGFSRIEKDEARQQREKIAEVLNAVITSENDKLSHYDIKKFLDVVDISIKPV